MYKKALIAAAAALVMASPAAADTFKYNLDGGGFIMIDNVTGEVVLQDAGGNQSFGQGESFKNWSADQPFGSDVRCNGICADHSNKFLFDSISGTFNGRDLSGTGLVTQFRTYEGSSLFNKISIWHPSGDIHVQPQQPIISSSSTSSGGSSTSTSGGGSTSGGSTSTSSGGVPVPAPGMLALFGLGAGTILWRRRKKA
ncbi:PEP-CTERM sorting domain-containing protein [uncultured Erythrobacter sp.]|uniref:PEP-CTERM sorting domain-containing protein n=1 Tax=uncultured Erythrobacter sp. TaxID=263913 RepID=UPI002606C734|nr:PEP-CTERM sorting domain-containing protein [uncultured Erythrobacter sp.]